MLSFHASMTGAAAHGSVMENQLRACIFDSLNLYLIENAKFLCERLFASYPNEDNAMLLATCYMRSDQAYRAYHTLQGCNSMQSRYLLALCCMKLCKYTEAEQALLPKEGEAEVPNGAAGHYLLGKICRMCNRHENAVRHFSEALRQEPLMWAAFSELCSLGSAQQAEDLLCSRDFCPPGGSADSAAGLSQVRVSGSRGPSALQAAAAAPAAGWAAPVAPTATTDRLGARQAVAPVDAAAAPITPAASTGVDNVAGQAAAPSSAFVTPLGGGGVPPTPAPVPRFPPRKQQPPSLAASTPSPLLGSHASQLGLFDSGSAAARHSQPQPNAPAETRRGAEPALNSRANCSWAGSAPAADAAAAMGSSPHCSVQRHYGLPLGMSTPEGAQKVLQLLRKLGQGWRLLCDYRCVEAIEAFMSLPLDQHRSGWVLSQIGRAYFEIVDYPRALHFFEMARREDPHRLEGLEVYSTVLWHMKRDVALSHLAQEALQLDRHAPQSWCVMGNCFSLQKEHETALKFFQRAIQLDCFFTYAYTLCGHEYFANEDFEKSLTFYRQATFKDPRHYNAWYGMGQIYYRQEKYELAANNFNLALQINPRSSVLRCYLGMALHKQGRAREALTLLDTAIEADEHNPLAKFEKANVLLSLDQLEAALQVLNSLKEIVPQEATVFFQVGKIYKRLAAGCGLKERKEYLGNALTHLCLALDLKPSSSDASLIKSAIEKINLPDDDEEEEI